MATINGTAAAETIVGTADADIINGGDGGDTIRGGNGNDVVHGDAGNDYINGEAGDDTLYGDAGNDTLTGDAGNDTLYGGDGNDGFFGGGGNDTMYGEAGADNMFGDGGNDFLYGGDGNDSLTGGTGDDLLVGGAGINTYNGGAGVDTAIIDITSAQLTTAGRADLAALKTFLDNQLATAGSTAALSAQTTGPSLQLASLGVTISNIETVKIFVDGVETPITSLINRAPVANSSTSLNTDEDTAISGNVGATDADGDTLGYTVAQGPANGTLSLNAATGAYTYTPGANYNGSDSFQVTVADGKGGTVTQTVSVGIAAVNDGPVAAATASLSTNEDVAISGQVVASDVDGDTLGYTVAQGPANGTLSLNAATGAYTYTPGANYNGSDSFQVTVADGKGGTVTQTVSVGIAAVNDGPVAAATASLSTNEDVAISGQVVASDVDGDTLGYTVAQGPANGTLSLNAATGAYTYTPGANYNGSDSFQVTVADGKGGTVTQTVSVGIAAVNDGPVAAATASLSTNEDVAISGQVVASDVDGDTLGYTVAQGPANGTLSLNAATGAYTYTPGANYNGSDSFQVTVSDGKGGTVTQTVSVGIAAVNDGPVAASTASASTDEDTAVSGQVVASDVDGDTLGYTVAQGPANGSVTLNAATGAYSYVGAANFNGSDSFKVTVSDAKGGTVTQTVNVGIAAVNDGPTAAATASISTNEDVAVSGQVVASDVDGDTLNYSVVSGQGPAHGTVTLNAATGAYTYAGAANYNGADTFKVLVSDGKGGSVTQTVNVGIAAVNDGPTAAATASISTNEDVAVSGQVVASDVDGDTLGYTVAQGPANGSVTLNAATGAYSYVGAANFNGSDSFKVTVSDGKGGTVTQTINVGIAAVADAPTLSVSSTSVAAGVTLNGTSGNDTLRGTNGNDIINGGAGDDVIYGNGGAAGTKTVALSIASALTDTDGSETLSLKITGVPSSATLSAGVRATDGSWTLTTAQLAGLTMTSTAASNVTLTVTATSTEATGPSASTSKTITVTVDQGTDSDTLDGGAGNDKIYGGAGNNVLIDGDGNDLVYGFGGNDMFKAGLGNDTYDGGAGIDTIDMSLSTTMTIVNLSTGQATGLGVDRLVSIENIIGSAQNNILTGSSVDNRIDGGAGADIISGGAGNDTLLGGDGNDQVDGGSGNDIIYDGSGDDIVNGGDGNDIIYAGSGLDKYVGGSGFDTLDYANATGSLDVNASKKTILGFTSDTIDGIEKIVGSRFDDNFTGGKLSNFFDGAAGNDTFRGMGGADTYTGGAGNDVYNWFVKDVLKGNTYLGADTITDFTSGQDKLNLREFTKAFPNTPIDQVVKMTATTAGTLVSVKIGAEFQELVVLQNVHGVTASGMLTSGDILI